MHLDRHWGSGTILLMFWHEALGHGAGLSATGPVGPTRCTLQP